MESFYEPGDEIWLASAPDSDHIIEFAWTLQNFSNMPIYLCSNERCSSEDCKTKTLWRMELHFYPSPRKTNSMEVYTKLHRTDSRGVSVKASFDVLLITKTKQVLFEASCTSMFACHLNSSSMSMWVEDEMLFLLPNDELMVRCNVVVSGCCRTTEIFQEIFISNNNTTRNMNAHLAQLQHDLRKAYENELLANVELVSGERYIRANRFMLCVRSPVFRKILEHQTEPNIRYNFDPIGNQIQALESFISYLYTGYSNGISLKVTGDLHSIAASYEVRSLQHVCSHVLFSKVSANTACGILKLADKHGDGILKEAALRFIRDNFHQVETTIYWNSLVQHFPILYTEVINYLTDATEKFVSTS